MPMETWVQIVERERRERGWSQDDLAYQARSHGAPRGLNSAWFSKVKQGERPATIDFLRGIARALGIEPERFIEYRLAKLRQLLDEREIGLENAAWALGQLEAGTPPRSLAQVDDSDAADARAAIETVRRAAEEFDGVDQPSPRKPAAKAKKRRVG